jgi:ketol-acid reductoisomerase
LTKSFFTDKDADLTLLKRTIISVIGYGNQGEAQALCLGDGGLSVMVGVRRDGESFKRASEAGFTTVGISEAAEAGSIIMVLLPDEVQEDIFQEQIAPRLAAGKTLVFAHGYNLRYGYITPPDGLDIILLSPNAPGHELRRRFLEGSGVNGMLAVCEDYSGKAMSTGLAIAKALGMTKAGVFKTTLREETETDLFAEQAVLCGGLIELAKAAFKVLTKAGYSPEVAYVVCVREMKFIVDAIYEQGIEGLRTKISSTAKYGGLTRGRCVIGESVVERMNQVLKEIQDGTFAAEWQDEAASGAEELERLSSLERKALISTVERKVIERLKMKR